MRIHFIVILHPVISPALEATLQTPESTTDGDDA